MTDANGSTRVRQKVKVSTSLGGNIFNREVALAAKSEIGDKGLFALNLCDKDDTHAIQQFVQGAEEGGKEDNQGCVFEEFDMVEIPKVRKGRVMKELP